MKIFFRNLLRNKYYRILILLLAVGIFLRFYQLGDIPQGFHRDEAFLGYNAYSILVTGKDMNGELLPLHLESFIFSPAGYSYFSLFPIAVFDLNPFSVRFASAFFGAFTVLITYLLARKLFLPQKHAEAIGLLSAGLVAVSPWHINLSRTATENTIVVFFVVLGVFYYIKYSEKKSSLFLLLSFLSFFVTLFLYQAPRAFLPFFIPLLFFSFSPYVKLKNMRASILFYALFIVLPLFFILTSPDLSLRIRTVSVFASEEVKSQLTESIPQDTVAGMPVFVTRVFHNKAISYTQQVLDNYFKHFSYSFLFTPAGLPDRYRVPMVGLLYLAVLPFLFIGMWYLLRSERRIGIFLLGWVLLAPIGSSLTFDDVPNLQRTLIMLPALQIISAYGFVKIFEKRKKHVTALGIFFFTLLLLSQIIFYLHQYYTHVPFYRPWYRQDGYEALVQEINKHSNNYEYVVITNRESAPTIFFLLFNKYSPIVFQKETRNSVLRDFDRVGFSKYSFSEEECPYKLLKERKTAVSEDTLYVNSGLCKIPEDALVLATIKRKDSSVVFYVVTKKAGLSNRL